MNDNLVEIVRAPYEGKLNDSFYKGQAKLAAGRIVRELRGTLSREKEEWRELYLTNEEIQSQKSSKQPNSVQSSRSIGSRMISPTS